MVSPLPLQPRLLSSFFGCLQSGSKHVLMRLSRPFSGLADLLFNKRNQIDLENTKRKHLRPGKISPCRPVPNHIPRPPYVNSRQPPGIASGSEVHDEKGIECMRASGQLAAQVLEYAGTLVKHIDALGRNGQLSSRIFEDQDQIDKYRYGVVQQFVGHGVGRAFPADPVILHFRNNEGGRMVLGQTFTIEPMLTIGSINPVMWDDDWTVVTEDGSLICAI